MKLALISFDGLDPRIVYRNRDILHNFDSFMEDSMHGKWQTPGHTIPSFTATLTGQQYEETNFHWDGGKGNYQRHRQTGHDYLWDVTDSSMTLLNLPVLYPPEDIDDAMVCGFLTPDDVQESNLAAPIEVQEYLNSVDYIPDVPADDTYDELGGYKMLDLLTDIMSDRVEVADWLINKYDSDLFYGVWSSTDRWFHQCHKHDEDFIDMYKLADEAFGEILEVIPNDIPIIAFSDHGFAHFQGDDGVHKGHMYEGWYSINTSSVPNCRDDSANIFDLYPTVLNYLDGEVPELTKGRILFHTEEQDDQVRSRLEDLGYLE